MTRKQYRKLVEILSVILFALNVGLIIRYFVLNEELLEIKEETHELETRTVEIRNEMFELEEDLNSESADKQELLKEYENWERQNQKLEDILR